MSSILAAVSAVQVVLDARPSALVTDIDGTLSPIVPRPEDASVSPIIARALEALTERLDLVAVITGREEAVARRMVQAEGPAYIGHYGLDDVSSEALHGDELDEAKASVRALLQTADLPCVTFEDKGLSFSLHYRHCEDGAATRQKLLDLAAPVAQTAAAKLIEGKQVVEMVPQGLPDKATAIRRLLAQAEIQGAVYFGDDLSDVVVFREIARRREEEGKRGLAVAIVDQETHPSVIEAADLRLAGVSQMEELLVALAAATPGGGE